MGGGDPGGGGGGGGGGTLNASLMGDLDDIILCR